MARPRNKNRTLTHQVQQADREVNTVSRVAILGSQIVFLVSELDVQEAEQ